MPSESGEPNKPRQRASDGRASSSATESLENALSRASGHARSAITESLAAIEALLDAASLASTGELARANGMLGPATQLLERMRNQFDNSDRDAGHLLDSIAKALEAEIERWEQRARDDPDARSVLRAFLGLRELLWEFGVRPAESGASTSPTSGRRKRSPASRRNVQRVTVEG